MNTHPSDADTAVGGSSGAREAFGEAEQAVATESETPALRAVALMRAEPSLVTAPPSFGAVPKPGPLGIARPSLGLKKPSIGIGRESTLDVKQEWSGLTQASTWNVKGEDLDMISDDFPLERTHRMIHGVSPEVVAQRVSEALRAHSIEAEYDCQKAKAKCKTADYVSFRVRLYAGGENCDPVVVEVQRRCGSVSSFMKSCRALLNAAEGKNESQVECPKMKVPAFKPMSQMKCLSKVMSTENEAVESSANALDDVMSMLKSNQRDTNLLGMENLVSLTDPIKTCATASLRVSKCVVFGDSKYEIREEMVALADRDVFESEEGMVTHMDRLRTLALSAFANALTVCSKEGCLEKALSEQRWFWDSLVPTLIRELKLASTSATTACSAATCLCNISACSQIARDQLRSQGIEELLSAAAEFGRTNHAMLFDETSRCLEHYVQESAD